jgi:large subunit ribosomal protein L4
MPKKVRRLGLKMALSYLLKEGKLFVIDNMKADGKTKSLAKQLNGFGIKKAVLIDVKTEDTMKRASRNLQSFRYYGVEGLNVFDLLKYDSVVLTKDSVANIADRCSSEVQR